MISAAKLWRLRHGAMSSASARRLPGYERSHRARYRRALMPEIEPTAELHEGFSQPDATARPWAEVVDVLSKSEMFWLSTVRRDGRPHVTPLPAIWLDRTLHFCAGAPEQKSKHLAAHPPRILPPATHHPPPCPHIAVQRAPTRVTA